MQAGWIVNGDSVSWEGRSNYFTLDLCWLLEAGVGRNGMGQAVTCHRAVEAGGVQGGGWARQAPLSLGLSRQEYWSGLSFPSPMHESEK